MTATSRMRAEVEAQLAALRIAGPNLAHSRENNLGNVRRLVAGDPGVTLGIRAVLERLRTDPPSEQEALDLIAGITYCSSDLDRTEGYGYISPSETYEGLRRAAGALGAAVEWRERIIFASGHPQHMDPAYEELAAWVRGRGCEVVTADPSGIRHHDVELALDGSVYVVARGAEPVHTHDYQPMEELLRRIPRPGFAVADHGFAGATLNAHIPTVCVMDTNDPGVALAASLGAPVTVVPLNDNALGEDLRAIAAIIRELAEGPQEEGA